MGAPGEGRYRNIAAGVWEGMMIWDRFWRRKQRDLPSRTEAIRRLVELGLKAKNR